MVWYELHWRITPIPILVGFFAQLLTKMLERPRLEISLVRFDIFWYLFKEIPRVEKDFIVQSKAFQILMISVKQHINGSWMFTLEWWTPQTPRKMEEKSESWKTLNHSLDIISSDNDFDYENKWSFAEQFTLIVFWREESFQLFSQYWIFTVFDVKKSNFFEKLSI